MVSTSKLCLNLATQTAVYCFNVTLMAAQVKGRMLLHVIYPWLYYRATRERKWKHAGFEVEYRKLNKLKGLCCSAAMKITWVAVHVLWINRQLTFWSNIPDNLNSSSDAILTDMSWEKRSFWGRANVSGRLVTGSLFSLAPKVLNASRWEAGGGSSAEGGSTSMGSAFTFTFW